MKLECSVNYSYILKRHLKCGLSQHRISLLKYQVHGLKYSYQVVMGHCVSLNQQQGDPPRGIRSKEPEIARYEHKSKGRLQN